MYLLIRLYYLLYRFPVLTQLTVLTICLVKVKVGLNIVKPRNRNTISIVFYYINLNTYIIMKKLILSSVLALGLVTAINAAPLTASNGLISIEETTTTYTTEVSTFCKLITKGDYDAVKSMITAGTDINKKSKGMTPLMYAARYNKTEIVKLLIASGADLKVRSDKGYTALKYAKISKAHDTYKLISEALDSKRKKERIRRREKHK